MNCSRSHKQNTFPIAETIRGIYSCLVPESHKFAAAIVVLFVLSTTGCANTPASGESRNDAAPRATGTNLAPATPVVTSEPPTDTEGAVGVDKPAATPSTTLTVEPTATALPSATTTETPSASPIPSPTYTPVPEQSTIPSEPIEENIFLIEFATPFTQDHVVYQSGGDLYLVDSSTTDVVRLTMNGGADPSWSPDRRKIAFVATTSVPQVALPEATVSRISFDGGTEPAFSPDGETIAYQQTLSNDVTTILLTDIRGDTTRVLTVGYEPTWAPDGSRLAYTDRYYELYVINADGSNIRHLPISNPTAVCPPDAVGHPKWSPVEDLILYVSHPSCMSGAGTSLYVSLLGDNSHQPVANLGFARGGSWSPDGNRIAVASVELNSVNIYDYSDRSANYSEPHRWQELAEGELVYAVAWYE